MDEKTRRRRGRPAYRPSMKDRVSVEQMKFCGESEDAIQGLCILMLRKHFAEELEHGRSNRMQEVLGWLFTAAGVPPISPDTPASWPELE